MPWTTGLALLFVATTALAGDGFVTREGAKLVLNGHEYRALGMNTPELFVSHAGIFFHLHEIYGTKENARQTMVTAVEEAEKHQIAFLRFYASGFWPKDMKLYFEAPEQYWAELDAVMALCRAHHVRVIPSIFFQYNLWPMLCGEDYSAIADPESKTYRAMHQYATELVSRYKDDRNVLAWELSNEMFLAADINMEGRDGPPQGCLLNPSKSNKTKLSVKDSLTTAAILKFYRDMAEHLQKLDPNHLVTSGDAGPRTCSASLRESFPNAVWTQDSLRQHLASLLNSQPEPLGLISLHHYGSLSTREPEATVAGLANLELLRAEVRCLHAAGSPVFLGELGHTKPTLQEDPEATYLRAAIDLMESEGVSLASVWAWYLRFMPECNVTAASHPALLERIAQFNAKHAQE